MLEPYLESGAMMTSYVAPIERGGRRVGVAGVDSSLRTSTPASRRVKVLDSGYAFVAADERPARRVPGAEGLGRQEDRRGSPGSVTSGPRGIPAAAKAGVPGTSRPSIR